LNKAYHAGKKLNKSKQSTQKQSNSTQDLGWLIGFDQRLKECSVLYLALFEHLKNAIEQGVLRAGDKLPTHRVLSQHLHIAVATVSKMYRYANEQGLVHSRVGKGSFVASFPVMGRAIRAQGHQCINLSIIKPLLSIGEPFLAKQLRVLSDQQHIADLMDYNVQGSLTDQHAAREWLMSQGVALNSKAISICSGAQHAIMVLINSLTEYGDCIGVEQYCYPGFISLANQLGRRLVAIEMDDQGINPIALEKACKQQQINMLIVVASNQNPTAALMSDQRRKQIADVVKKFEIKLVDDDVYGFLSPQLSPIANYAPKLSFYLTSFSKSIFPGLRVAYIAAPAQHKERIDAHIRQSIWMPAPMMLALATRLVFAGSAAQIQSLQSIQAEKRQQIAAKLLSGFEYLAQSNSYHLWLKLPEKFSSESFCLALEKRGVIVSNAAYFDAISTKPCAAVRVSLMAPATDEELIFALNIVVNLLKEGL